ENTFPIQLVEQAEAPFEYDYLLKHKDYVEGSEIWCKVSKRQENFWGNEVQTPLYITIPKEDIMLLE
ncbi:MAG: hypothetical protein K0S18_2005, partial [Anaerocolumna sp.]|nr:hypothetical protein [Anaerocolumna sp.]